MGQRNEIVLCTGVRTSNYSWSNHHFSEAKKEHHVVQLFRLSTS